MSYKRNEVVEPNAVQELDRLETKMVAGGWVEVVRGPDGAPGCVVVHPGLGPRFQ